MKPTCLILLGGLVLASCTQPAGSPSPLSGEAFIRATSRVAGPAAGTYTIANPGGRDAEQCAVYLQMIPHVLAALDRRGLQPKPLEDRPELLIFFDYTMQSVSASEEAEGPLFPSGDMLQTTVEADVDLITGNLDSPPRVSQSRMPRYGLPVETDPADGKAITVVRLFLHAYPREQVLEDPETQALWTVTAATWAGGQAVETVVPRLLETVAPFIGTTVEERRVHLEPAPEQRDTETAPD